MNRKNIRGYSGIQKIRRTHQRKKIRMRIAIIGSREYENRRKIKDFILHEGLIYLEKKNHKFLANIYDVIARTTSFFNLICNKKNYSSNKFFTFKRQR